MNDKQATEGTEAWGKAVNEAIRSLRFGSVVVVVHEGKVTQIEKREKIRPHAPDSSDARDGAPVRD